jgi:hypothetical protein
LVRRFRPYRLASLVPLLLIVLLTLVGGWLNGVEMHGRVVDSFTSDPVGTAGPARITHGSRSTTADPSTGVFTFPNLPRESLVSVDAPGYLRTSVPVTQEEVRMSALSFTIQVNKAGTTEPVPSVEIRQNNALLNTTNTSGNLVLSPYPGNDATLLLCAKGYDQKEVKIRGVAGTFELTPGTNECPPLPTPTPSPSPSPSASPSASPGASPSAAPTPSPTASP